MPILIVVNTPSRWPLALRGVEVVSARRYLSDPVFHRLANTRVFNLCRSYSYQSLGYYVSLLAEARDQRPEPDVTTIQDMKSASLFRSIAEDLDEMVQKTLRSIRGDSFTLSIYFGQTLARRDRDLGRRLFGRFRAPLLRAQFARRKHKWQLQNVGPISAKDIPAAHHEAVIAAAEEYFARRVRVSRPLRSPRYYLAVLMDPDEDTPPSNTRAIRKLVRAARRQGVSTEMITRDDYGRLPAFDALFIRTTTAVNHYTYRFARRASAERLAVIDDPLSIARCTNKVYLAELLRLHRVATPHTVIVGRDNLDQVLEELAFPIVLKQPDSAFSMGVTKVHDAAEFKTRCGDLLEHSEVIVAQSFVPSEYDWRVGVLDREPIYVCKYYMAANHWQIVKWRSDGKALAGRVETLAVAEAPPDVVKAAVRAARHIGDGLYGVDLKTVGDRSYVIEVNDNPNIDAGVEDKVLGQNLYDTLIRSFVARIERLRHGGRGRD